MTSINIGCGNIGEKCDVMFDIRKTPITTRTGDARNMPFRDNTFDFAICKHLLEHFEEGYDYGVLDQSKVLQEIRRILKPKGKVYIVVPAGYGMIFYDHKRVYSMGDWIKLFKRNGFKVKIAKGGLLLQIISKINPFIPTGDGAFKFICEVIK